MKYPEITVSHKRNLEPACIPFCVEHGGPDADDGLHIHDFHQLTMITRGSGVLVLNGTGYPVRAGDLYVIGSFSAHCLKDMRGLEFLNVLFYLRDLEPFCRELQENENFQTLFYLQPTLERQTRPSNIFSLDYGDMETVNRLLEQLLEEQQGQRPGRLLMVQSLFLTLIVTLCRVYPSDPQTPSPFACSLGQTIRYLEAHCAEQLTLADLARQSAMTERQLRHQFSKLCGCTPLQYLWNLRIRKACYYLASTDLPIVEIAALVGFEDNNYFSRKFRQALSMTPRDYRNHSRGLPVQPE